MSAASRNERLLALIQAVRRHRLILGSRWWRTFPTHRWRARPAVLS